MNQSRTGKKKGPWEKKKKRGAPLPVKKKGPHLGREGQHFNLQAEGGDPPPATGEEGRGKKDVNVATGGQHNRPKKKSAGRASKRKEASFLQVFEGRVAVKVFRGKRRGGTPKRKRTILIPQKKKKRLDS